MIMSGGACEIGSVPLPNVTWLIAAIAQFDSTYGAIHPYIALFLCIAGTVMNVVTVLVLTRPSMISPVNVLLCSVAVCDVIVMTSYLVFVSHFLIGAANRCDQRDYSFSWAVSLAQIRVLTISRATSGPTTTITIRLTVVLSFATCLIMACVNIPNFLTFEIVEMAASTFLPCLLPDSTYETDDGNSTAISVDTFYENELP
ncbi:unnamed protein product, partial [Toxocara canis]|uniref:G_PROTEIN_RECEP_F1_2 domain-containing protein n=1 Tax=Toxocara canis TaxID=6265 RepID=A0A183TYU2_TOXCA